MGTLLHPWLRWGVNVIFMSGRSKFIGLLVLWHGQLVVYRYKALNESLAYTLRDEPFSIDRFAWAWFRAHGATGLLHIDYTQSPPLLIYAPGDVIDASPDWALNFETDGTQIRIPNEALTIEHVTGRLPAFPHTDRPNPRTGSGGTEKTYDYRNPDPDWPTLPGRPTRPVQPSPPPALVPDDVSIRASRQPRLL